jgi:hypothetical protein
MNYFREIRKIIKIKKIFGSIFWFLVIMALIYCVVFFQKIVAKEVYYQMHRDEYPIKKIDYQAETSSVITT